MKRFYARYTPEMVSSICGCSADDFLKVAELITSTDTRRSRRHDHVCARLDAAQPLGAADPRGGDAAAAARQHRPARRRAQRAARPRQHPGRHRLRHGVSQPARLHRRSRRPITTSLEHVHRRGDAEAAAAERPRTSGPTTDSFVGQPAQGVLRQPRRRADNEFGYAWHPKLPQSAPGATRTGAGPTSSTTCTAATWKGSSASA